MIPKFSIGSYVYTYQYGTCKVLEYDVRFPHFYTLQMVCNDNRLNGKILYNIREREIERDFNDFSLSISVYKALSNGPIYVD